MKAFLSSLSFSPLYLPCHIIHNQILQKAKKKKAKQKQKQNQQNNRIHVWHKNRR